MGIYINLLTQFCCVATFDEGVSTSICARINQHWLLLVSARADSKPDLQLTAVD